MNLVDEDFKKEKAASLKALRLLNVMVTYAFDESQKDDIM